MEQHADVTHDEYVDDPTPGRRHQYWRVPLPRDHPTTAGELTAALARLREAGAPDSGWVAFHSSDRLVVGCSEPLP